MDEPTSALQAGGSLIAAYREAASVSGRSLAALILESLRLRLSHLRLGLTEYLDFQLYLDDLTFSEKAAFGGMRAQMLLEEILIDDYARFLSLDKITMYALLQGHGFPVPEVRAVYDSLRPRSICSIDSAMKLERYLRESAHLPVYVKRAFGAFGRGNMLIDRIEGNNVILGTGEAEPVSEFCRSLDQARTLGWILQEPITPHPAIRDLTWTDKVSGIRLHTFRASNRVSVIRAVFKINGGESDADNFRRGAKGNMVGAIDVATGKVSRTASGAGLGLVRDSPHPRSGAAVVGFEIPYWKDILVLVQDAHAAFPGYICPGWDLAVCDDGPKIIEVNAFGDLDLSQYAERKGFLDEDFLSLMRAAGLEKLLYLGRRRWKRSRINNRFGIRSHHWPW